MMMMIIILINFYEQSGFTPLHIASHYGNTNVGKLLIEKGADVNYKARVRRKFFRVFCDEYYEP